MESTGTISKPEIQIELKDRQKALDAQIDHLERFITDLISYKISLENANRQIEKLASAEPDIIKRNKYYKALRVNIELLTKIFDSISKLEHIKHQYHKEIDEVILDKIKLIAVDIRKLDERSSDGDGNLVGFFEKLGNAMSNLNKGESSVINSSITYDSDYKL